MRLPIAAPVAAPIDKCARPAISCNSGHQAAGRGRQPQPTLIGRLRELDALRGLAVITVMLYHYTTRYDELYRHLPGLPFRVGEGSVLLVFMITGFAIAMTVAKKPNCKDFMLARAGRLLPTYWVAILLTHEVVFRFGLPGREVGFGTTVANLTMVQHFLGIAEVDGAYWSLAVQLSFYLVMAVLLVTGQFKQRVKFGAIWLGVLFVVALADRFVHPVPPALRTLVMYDYGTLFIAGVMFYCLQADAKAKHQSIAIILGCLAFGYLFHDSRTFKLSALFCAMFFLLSTGRLKWLASKPLDFVASISYPLYLLHQQIGYVVIREAYHFGVTSPSIAIVCAIGVSLILATIVSLSVERPAMEGIVELRKTLRGNYPLPLTLKPRSLGTTSPATR